MIKQLIKYSLFLFLLFGANGCVTYEKPEPFLDADEYAALLADLAIVKSNKETLRYTDLKMDYNELQDVIFDKYGLNEAQFEQINSWYSKQPQLYNKVFKESVELIKKMKAKEEKSPL